MGQEQPRNVVVHFMGDKPDIIYGPYTTLEAAEDAASWAESMHVDVDHISIDRL